MSKKEFMNLVIRKALDGVRKWQAPFGACIVKNGEVLACEHNAVWSSIDATAHAKVVAIREACKKLKSIDLSGCEIYCTCEPCPMCFSACHWAKITKILYGASISDTKKAGFNELEISCIQMKHQGNCRVEIEAGLMRQECLNIFREWKKNQGKGY